MTLYRLMAVGRKPAAMLFLFLIAAVLPASGQSLSVVPVNIFFGPGQRATTMTVTNEGKSETSIQIRPFAWKQPHGEDQLAATDAVVVSPPIASIAPGASQVIRLFLRQAPQGGEATYRILLDQIPPPAEPGVVHVVLRLSIPIFAAPNTRALPRLEFHLEQADGQLYLVGTNDGLRHEVIRDIVLSTENGGQLKAETGASPYILAGVTRRWRIVTSGTLPAAGESLRLTARTDAGALEQRVSLVTAP